MHVTKLFSAYREQQLDFKYRFCHVTTRRKHHNLTCIQQRCTVIQLILFARKLHKYLFLIFFSGTAGMVRGHPFPNDK